MTELIIIYKELAMFIKSNKTNNKCFCMRCSHIFDMLFNEWGIYHVRQWFSGDDPLDTETMRKIWVEQFGKTFNRNKLGEYMKIKGDCGMIGWPEEDNNLIVEF